jgi:hypothetical protein
MILEPGLYRLHNHDDGGARPPLYGLRLDELVNVTPDHDVFSFSFDDGGAQVFLELGLDTSIRITGTVFGGHDVGDDWDVDLHGLWEIDFTYNASKPAPDDDDIIVNPPAEPNTGSIKPLFGDSANIPIDLFDYPGSFPFTLRLGNEDDDLGHRGWTGISGWGWLNHRSADVHFDASDWLFTVDPIPVPGPPTAAILLVALAAACPSRARRQTEKLDAT